MLAHPATEFPVSEITIAQTTPTKLIKETIKPKSVIILIGLTDKLVFHQLQKKASFLKDNAISLQFVHVFHSKHRWK